MLMTHFAKELCFLCSEPYWAKLRPIFEASPQIGTTRKSVLFATLMAQFRIQTEKT